jgi:hypothetical protein
VAEWGPMGRTPSGHVKGLAALVVNLLNNMILECCEQLTTWPLRKEHNFLHQPNLANSLCRRILLGIKMGRKPTKKQGKNPEVRKVEML